MDSKAPGQFWDTLGTTMLSKYSLIWNKEHVNTYMIVKIKSVLYVGPVNIFQFFILKFIRWRCPRKLGKTNFTWRVQWDSLSKFILQGWLNWKDREWIAGVIVTDCDECCGIYICNETSGLIKMMKYIHHCSILECEVWDEIICGCWSLVMDG